MMVFCNFLEIKAETKKVVGVKVVPFGVLYSCVKFRRLKMGDPVYGDILNFFKLEHKKLKTLRFLKNFERFPEIF